MNAPPAAPRFDEIRRILRDLPGPDLEAQTKVVARQTELTKPPGSLGRLEASPAAASRPIRRKSPSRW
jgi:nicotinate-nucleotide--dimethylbenzimidazole phosphoribosyltransferase